MHWEVLLGVLDFRQLKTIKANMYVAIALLFEVPPFLSFIGSSSFISWIILDMLLMTQFSLIVVFPTEIIMRFSREHVNWAPHTFYGKMLSSYFRREMKVLWSKPKGSQTNPITISVSCPHAHLKWKSCTFKEMAFSIKILLCELLSKWKRWGKWGLAIQCVGNFVKSRVFWQPTFCCQSAKCFSFQGKIPLTRSLFNEGMRTPSPPVAWQCPRQSFFLQTNTTIIFWCSVPTSSRFPCCISSYF